MSPNKELMVAITTKDEATIKRLLAEKKVNINEPDSNGNTPLNYACAMGTSEDFIIKMIELGADVKLKNNLGAAPLTHAVYSKMSPSLLEALVKAGAEVNYKNESGGTALQIACVCKAGTAVITKLIELGADPDLANNHNHTPLMFAVRNHNEHEVIAHLCKHVKNINATCEDEKYLLFTALHFAAGEHLPAVAATLVNHGADTAAKNADGYTPLQLADENTRTAMLSASFAKFNMGNPPPADAIVGGAAGDRVSIKKAPLRRTSLLAQGAPGASSTPPRDASRSPSKDAIKEEEEGGGA